MNNIYSKLKSYSESDYYPYHMPGHKRKKLTDPLNTIADIDITEIYDFDNLSDPSGILMDAQNKLANYIGVQKSYFLVNGSTVGILTAISSVVPKGGKLLLARNAHKSTYHAMCIRDIAPVYVYPDLIRGMNIYEAVTPKQIEDALAENDKDINAVIVVSPTYEGRIADIKKISDIVHSYGIPLIVDEAHGAHLDFSDGIDGYPASACKLGSDIVVQSLHKTTPSPTQTAVMHVNSDLVDIERIDKFLHVYQSSSPSYPLMAAMEASVDYMMEHGAERLRYMKERFCSLIDDVNRECIYIEAMPFVDGVQDVGKFVFSAIKAGKTGKDLADILRDKYHLEFEMSVREYVLAMFTVADEDEAYDRLRVALIELDKIFAEELKHCIDNCSDNVMTGSNEDFEMISIGEKSEISESGNVNAIYSENINTNYSEAVYPMSVAWDMKGTSIDIQDAEGYCANEFIGLYPPGTPILVPGERITKSHIDDLQKYIDCGYEVTGITNGKIKIID